MLNSLTINNVVLIENLCLQGEAGLCVLTGETGAGKSILLDALGLALGSRAESKLVRHGTEQAIVTAEFDVPDRVIEFLKDREIDLDGGNLILRRTLNKDGKSKAFINDVPVTVQLLKELGSQLVEIHGQFETQGLMNTETHLPLLDNYAGIDTLEINKLYSNWKSAQEDLEQAKADIANSKLQEEYLTYAVKELEQLSPQIGEEEDLAEKRKRLMNREKAQEAFDQASQLLEDEQGILTLFGKLQAIVGRAEVASLNEAVNRAKSELDEVSYQIENYKSGNGDDSENLEQIEDRYFALKDCARKHRATVDELPQVWEELSHKLRLITHQEDELSKLEKQVEENKKQFVKLAEVISKKRSAVAKNLDKAVNAELPALKLDKAKFIIEVEKTDDWNSNGFDKVRFLVSTNPQTPAGPINKIASGGELARFMLALKVVLAETGTIETLIFDEVDSGIGGATADAVGERLARLSDKYQILVVTHSPQVAARGNSHWVISKSETKGKTTTGVYVLTSIEDRQEEIARMISGAKVTPEAKAAAAKLLERDQAHAA